MDTIGRYRVLGLIGGGGMATVYKAEHPGLDEIVAVKVLHPHLAADPDFLSRFRREAKAIARLRHPNIVRWLDFDNDGDVYFMVMEFIEGPPLDARLRELASRGKRMSPAEVLGLLRPIASALDYAHGEGFVHRDLKPANILHTSKGAPVITDFGIARFVEQSGLTQTGTVMGSAHYMSPEQIQAMPVDGRSDLYSLGIILFEALTGGVPFDGPNTAVILAKHLTDPVPAARDIDPTLPSGIDEVMRRVLAKDPGDRYGTAADLAQAFEGALRQPTVVVPRPSAAPMEIEVEEVVRPETPLPADAPPDPRPSAVSETRVDPPSVPQLWRVDPPASSTPLPVIESGSSAKGWPRRPVFITVIVVLVVAAIGVAIFVALRPGGSPTASATTSTLRTTTSTLVTTTSTLVADAPRTYAIGDPGPAGGIVFYDKGDTTDGWRYLEAAPADTEWQDKPWGERGTTVPGADGTAAGTGKQNAAAIVAAQGTGGTYAAQLCDALASGGTDDWFLPSRDELNLMYENLHKQGLGGFRPGYYWSSSQYDADDARAQSFADGTQYWAHKDYRDRVRAARAF